MIPDINLSLEAKLDLIEIQDFIAQDNPQKAARVIDDIFKAFEHLTHHPLTGHKRTDLTTREVRFWSVYSYLIVYDASTKPISIVRILSSYRDIQSLLVN